MAQKSRGGAIPRYPQTPYAGGKITILTSPKGGFQHIRYQHPNKVNYPL